MVAGAFPPARGVITCSSDAPSGNVPARCWLGRGTGAAGSADQGAPTTGAALGAREAAGVASGNGAKTGSDTAGSEAVFGGARRAGGAEEGPGARTRAATSS